MQERRIIERLEILEETVGALEELPFRVGALESQLVQLRDEMRGEFSATRDLLRSEIRQGDEETRRILHETFDVFRDALRAEIREGDEETRRQMRALREELGSRVESLAATTRDALRAEIRDGDEETRRFMRVLHEDLVSKLATIQEHRAPRKKQ